MTNTHGGRRQAASTTSYERGKFMRKFGKVFAAALVVVLLTSLLCVPASAAAGNVSSAIEGTWNSAKSEVKNVVNNVVFPVLDLVLAVFFFVKLGGSYFECASVKAI